MSDEPYSEGTGVLLKAMDDEGSQQAIADFAAADAADPLRELYLGLEAEQFAALHHLADEK